MNFSLSDLECILSLGLCGVIGQSGCIHPVSLSRLFVMTVCHGCLPCVFAEGGEIAQLGRVRGM